MYRWRPWPTSGNLVAVKLTTSLHFLPHSGTALVRVAELLGQEVTQLPLQVRPSVLNGVEVWGVHVNGSPAPQDRDTQC